MKEAIASVMPPEKLRWVSFSHWEPDEWATRTLLCGDLFTQPGHEVEPMTERDILGPSEAFRKMMNYYSNTKDPMALMEKLARCEPTTLACMHGSSWRGDGAKLLRELAKALDS